MLPVSFARALTLGLLVGSLAGCVTPPERPASRAADETPAPLTTSAAPVVTASPVITPHEPPVARGPAWQPASTRAVIAGVLRWDDPKITSFSDVHRKDDELAKLLVTRGVPADRVITLLDEAAHGAAILGAIEAQARAAEPGSTLLVYYAGHGTKSQSGEIGFLGYDAGARGAITMTSIVRAVAPFRGARVLLMADCCHSGGLAEVARALEARGVQAAAITSAESSNTSTVNWTFTQAVIDAIGGDGLCDHDADGDVDLGELAAEARSAMKHREKQRAGIALGMVAPALTLAPVTFPAPPRGRDAPVPGDYVSAPRGLVHATARVRERRGDTLAVELYDYADKSIVHVPAASVRPVAFDHYEPGAKLRVSWGGRTWDAEVLRVEDDFHLITYPGWSSWWDEWIASDRVVGRR